MLLTVTPSMIDNECLPSYLLRLTVRNGFKAPYDWLSQPTFHSATIAHFSNKQMKELTDKTGVITPTKPCLFSGNLSPLFLSPTLIQPRICPKCIKEHGYIKSEWLNLFTLKCFRHDCLLVDYCSECHQQLQWNISLLTNNCSNPHCNKFIQSPSKKAFPLTLTMQQISDCLVAHFFTHDIYATTLSKLKYFEMNNFNNQLMQGFELLSDRETFEKWSVSLNQKSLQQTEFPQDIRFYPWYLFKESMQCNWHNLSLFNDLKFESKSLKEASYPIPLKIPAEQVMKSLGITTFQLKDVLSLIDQNYLTNKRISPKRLIDMVAFTSKLINNSTVIKNGKTISEITSDESKKLTDLYIEIMSSTIPFNYSPKASFKTSIKVNQP